VIARGKLERFIAGVKFKGAKGIRIILYGKAAKRFIVSLPLKQCEHNNNQPFWLK
jgi:hypothetical protein